MNTLGGYDIEDLTAGMHATFAKTVTDADIVLFAGISGDTNPVHLDAEAAAGTLFKERIAHGMLSAGFISAVLGTRLPGPGCIYLSQSLKFLAPVPSGTRCVRGAKSWRWPREATGNELARRFAASKAKPWSKGKP